MGETAKISRFLLDVLKLPKEYVDDQLISLFSFESFKKADKIFDINVENTKVYFIYSGSAIAWRHKANSERIVIERVFYEPGVIMVSDFLFEFRTKSIMYVSAINDLKVISMQRDDYARLTKENNPLARAFLEYLNADLVATSRWYFTLTFLRELPAKERLENFLQCPYYKNVIEVVQKKMIPSLLDMNSRTYERVKKEIKITEDANNEN